MRPQTGSSNQGHATRHPSISLLLPGCPQSHGHRATEPPSAAIVSKPSASNLGTPSESTKDTVSTDALTPESAHMGLRKQRYGLDGTPDTYAHEADQL